MSKFIKAIEHELAGIKSVSPGPLCGPCGECNSSYDHDSDEAPAEQPPGEGNFSIQSCDSCGSSLGGDRFDAHGLGENGDIIHLDICVDCVMFHANGDEPEQWEG